jgi:hypothetical protein
MALYRLQRVCAVTAALLLFVFGLLALQRARDGNRAALLGLGSLGLASGVVGSVIYRNYKPCAPRGQADGGSR